MFDLDAYLGRIGLNGRPSIAQVHRAHLTSIPFENLDPHQGVPVSLEVEDLERKLVTERRGGYCFEQNLLLKAALEALGAEVDMFLARMRLPGSMARPPDTRGWVGHFNSSQRSRAWCGPAVTLSFASARTAQAGTPTWGSPAASSSRSHSGRAPRRSSRAGAFASSRTAPGVRRSRSWRGRMGRCLGLSPAAGSTH